MTVREVKQQKRKQILQTTASVVLFVAVFTVCDVFSFGLIFELLHDKLSELTIQVIASLISLLLTGVILTTARFSILLRYKSAFVQVNDVIENLTKGNFDVTASEDYRIDPKLGEFVKSVDTMAVELRKLENMRRDFVSNVSHEIQSPLTSIKGYAQALQVNSTPEQRKYLTIIQQESDRLSKLSDNLLRLASLDSDTTTLTVGNFRLDAQIRSAILSLEPQWAAKNIDLQVDLDALSVTADEELLMHVWLNLISNAIKFTESGGSISITLEKQNENAVVAIKDTGIGIAEHDLPHIFDRFYKADTSRNTYKGSGLGLSIAKRIIELSGGTITVKSDGIGRGTEVRVVLRVM
jgi:signal transduction histidine kinase